MLLSVLIPVRNEADNILPLLEELEQALSSRYGDDFEVIYVDDASTDQTWQRLLQAQHQYRWLRLLQHQQAAGQSTAVHSGALAAHGEWLATLDGDGQNNPADLPRLLETVRDAHQQQQQITGIIGYRRQRQDSTIKILSSRLANRFRGWLLKDDSPDNGCGIKILRRSTYQQLPYFDHMHRFIPSLVMRCGQHMLVAPVDHRPRLKGRSKYGTWNRLWVGIIDLLGVIWLNARAKQVQAREEKP